MKKNIVIAILLTLSITNCSMYKNEFDCPANKGLGCISVSHVNDLVNDGVLDDESKPEKVTIWFKAAPEIDIFI